MDRGSSTIDYVIASIELFPKFSDFYIDILDSGMSDVYCPVCVLISCKESYKKDKILKHIKTLQDKFVVYDICLYDIYLLHMIYVIHLIITYYC